MNQHFPRPAKSEQNKESASDPYELDELYFRPDFQLEQIESTCWQLLKASVKDQAMAWRLPVLGTVAADRCALRTVVLRSVESSAQKLVIHTDARSPKVLQIQANAEVSLLFYDHERRAQLLVHGRGSVHTNDSVADAIWESESRSSLRGYLAPLAPGMRTEQPEVNLPSSVRDNVPERSELQQGRVNFAVVQCAVTTVECLMLHAKGNLRALFEYSQGRKTDQSWIAP